MNSEIIVVSGLPRSGTSLMMQMLDKGGVEVITDNIRIADADNPKGYYEYEMVKKIGKDSSWLPSTRGKAFKMVSQLLYDLPAAETYRIIFMDRDLEETLFSQEKMLQRLGRQPAPREDMKRNYAIHLDRLHKWLLQQPNVTMLPVNYNDLLKDPRKHSERVRKFLGGSLNIEEMVKAVDPSLYRNRSAGREPATGAPA